MFSCLAEFAGQMLEFLKYLNWLSDVDRLMLTKVSSTFPDNASKQTPESFALQKSSNTKPSTNG